MKVDLKNVPTTFQTNHSKVRNNLRSLFKFKSIEKFSLYRFHFLHTKKGFLYIKK